MKTITILATLALSSAIASAEVKFSAGLYTVHAPGSCSSGNCIEFNTRNELFAISTKHFVFGRMINSYNYESYLFGIKNRLYRGDFSLDYGVVAATNYPKNTLSKDKALDLDHRVVLFCPLISTAYNINEFFSVEATTQFSAINIGIGVRF